MKKISMFLFATVLLVSFTACKGGKKAEEAVVEPVAEELVEPVQETPPAVEITPAEALKAFQAFAKEYGEAFNNLTKDPQKYMQLAGQVQQKVADMEQIKADLNPAQIKDYTKALKIIKDVNSGGAKK